MLNNPYRQDSANDAGHIKIVFVALYGGSVPPYGA